MAKILTDKEMARIIDLAVNNDEIDDSDSYQHFLEGLAELITTHFGGERGNVDKMDTDHHTVWTAAFYINDCVPDDGGIYKRFDRDVVWKNGEETEKKKKA